MADWHDAQVIKATTEDGERITATGMGAAWYSTAPADYRQWTDAQLTDVRVIVNADGNVTPPEITDEMVQLGMAPGLRAYPEFGKWPTHRIWRMVESVLNAALGGHRG